MPTQASVSRLIRSSKALGKDIRWVLTGLEPKERELLGDFAWARCARPFSRWEGCLRFRKLPRQCVAGEQRDLFHARVGHRWEILYPVFKLRHGQRETGRSDVRITAEGLSISPDGRSILFSPFVRVQ